MEWKILNKKTLLIFSLVTAFSLHASIKDTWESTELIWSFGIIAECDIGTMQSPVNYFQFERPFNENDYENIKRGDVVWLRCKYIPQFYTIVLPKIKDPFVLVISDGDESFPSDCGVADVESFISNDKIIHIFAQNCDYRGPGKKVSHLPIGLDLHSIAYKGSKGWWGEVGSPKDQEASILAILQELPPTYLRKIGAFVDFQLNDTTHAGFNRYLQFGEDRAAIFNRLVPTGLIDYAGPLNRSALWRTKGQYAFSISPHGNGLDCHRTWEDLVLGCIVIVKTSPLDPLYEGLPVVIVKDWSEITRENMEKWLSQYGDAFTNPVYREKLTNAYWLQKIHAAAAPYKIESDASSQ